MSAFTALMEAEEEEERLRAQEAAENARKKKKRKKKKKKNAAHAQMQDLQSLAFLRPNRGKKKANNTAVIKTVNEKSTGVEKNKIDPAKEGAENSSVEHKTVWTSSSVEELKRLQSQGNDYTGSRTNRNLAKSNGCEKNLQQSVQEDIVGQSKGENIPIPSKVIATNTRHLATATSALTLNDSNTILLQDTVKSLQQQLESSQQQNVALSSALNHARSQYNTTLFELQSKNTELIQSMTALQEKNSQLEKQMSVAAQLAQGREQLLQEQLRNLQNQHKQLIQAMGTVTASNNSSEPEQQQQQQLYNTNPIHSNGHAAAYRARSHGSSASRLLNADSSVSGQNPAGPRPLNSRWKSETSTQDRRAKNQLRQNRRFNFAERQSHEHNRAGTSSSIKEAPGHSQLQENRSRELEERITSTNPPGLTINKVK